MNETEYLAKLAEIKQRYEPVYQKWKKSKKARDAEIISLTEKYNAMFPSEWEGGCYLPETDEEAGERYKQVLADRATIPWLKEAAQEKSLSEKEISRKKRIAGYIADGLCYLPEMDQETKERYEKALAEKVENPLSEMEIARRKCITDLLATELWIVSDEPKRLVGGTITLQICEKKKSKTHYYDHPCPVLVYLSQGLPVLPTFVKEFTEKYNFVAYISQVSHYTGPN